MRWSERPPAVRLRFASLQAVHCDPRTLSVAVAHLVLVRMMRGALSGIAVAIVSVIGVVVSVWSAFSFASHALFLSRHGVQKWAHVLKFSSVTTGRGGSTFYYFVEIDGVPRERGFPHRLREGSVIPLLASPTDANDFEIGHVGDTPFDVFAHHIGSRFFAYVFLLFYPFFFFVLLPYAVWGLWREHQKGGGLFRLRSEASSNQALQPTAGRRDK